MHPVRTRAVSSELTPVDDVRRVRERLSRQAGGDVRRLIRCSREAGRRWREKIGAGRRRSAG